MSSVYFKLTYLNSTWWSRSLLDEKFQEIIKHDESLRDTLTSYSSNDFAEILLVSRFSSNKKRKLTNFNS